MPAIKSRTHVLLALAVIPNGGPRIIELDEERGVGAHEGIGVFRDEHVHRGDARVDDGHGQEREEEAGEEADDAEDDGPVCLDGWRG